MDWEAYFDSAWSARAEMFERLAAQGLSLGRTLALFDDYERRFALTNSADAPETARYVPDPKFDSDPFANLDRETPKLIRGNLAALSPYWRFDVARLLADLAQGCDCVVELGSGYGRQVFDLWLAGGPQDARYVAAEPSPAGRALGTRLAALEPCLTMEQVDFTLADPDFGFVGEASETLVFTCWAIYACPQVHADFFKRLAAMPGRVRCVFIEPISYQLPGSPALEGARRHNLNLNFHHLFQEAVDAGLIEPMQMSFDLFSHSGDRLQYGSVLVAAKA